jgi:hypothetical protein
MRKMGTGFSRDAFPETDYVATLAGAFSSEVGSGSRKESAPK